MILNTDSDELHKRSYENSNIADDGLLSLLRGCSSPFLDTPVSASHPFPPPISLFEDPFENTEEDASEHPFEDPFDDRSMEPVPLAPPNTLSGHVPILQSIDDTPPASTQNLLLSDGCLSPLPLDANIRQDLIRLLDPAKRFVGSKRSSEYLFSKHGPLNKRQRTSGLQAAAPDDEESMARFRPYQEKQWREQLKKLVQYKLENGHCCVPHSYTEDPVLARWVKRQRYQYKKLNDCNPTSTMTKRRIQELESIGFVWHTHAAAWQEKLNELKAFKQQKGHCRVPSHYPQNTSLSTWVKCQRRQHKLYTSGKSSTMTMERKRVLESLGFAFDVSQRS